MRIARWLIIIFAGSITCYTAFQYFTGKNNFNEILPLITGLITAITGALEWKAKATKKQETVIQTSKDCSPNINDSSGNINISYGGKEQ